MVARMVKSVSRVCMCGEQGECTHHVQASALLDTKARQQELLEVENKGGGHRQGTPGVFSTTVGASAYV